MPAAVHLDRGDGPVVVLLHGVGAGPESFAPVVELLHDGHRCVVVERPGGGGGPVVPLDEQADQVAALVADVGAAGGRLVGVSGGATLGLLLALRHPHLFADHLLHEPLLGPLAPALHDRFRQAAALAASGEAGALEVVRQVMGPGAWEALGADGRAWATAQTPRWQQEIARFAAFAPSPESLMTLRSTTVITTLGAASGAERAAAALVLQHLAHAPIVEVPGAGNAVQLDAPEAFAQIIRSYRPTAVGGTR